ncbi:MAG: hypothetical protein WCJ30_10420, partial [Deltaproteobacteria bacterium]
LWFDPTTFAVTDNAAEKRTEVRAAAASGLLPGIVPLTQPAIANGQSGAGTRQHLLYASLGAPTHITGAQMFAGGALTASNSDYITWSFWECDEAGAHVGSALASGTTKLIAAGGTGPWAGGALAIDAGFPTFDLAAGHTLAIEWDTATHAATRSLPGGFWRVL